MSPLRTLLIGDPNDWAFRMFGIMQTGEGFGEQQAPFGSSASYQRVMNAAIDLGATETFFSWPSPSEMKRLKDLGSDFPRADSESTGVC